MIPSGTKCYVRGRRRVPGKKTDKRHLTHSWRVFRMLTAEEDDGLRCLKEKLDPAKHRGERGSTRKREIRSKGMG